MSRKTRKLKNKLLVPFEWIGIGLGLCIIPWLPRAALFALCDALSCVLLAFDRRGKRRALENLRIVRGRHRDVAAVLAYDPDLAPYDPTPTERRILRRSYRNMCRTVGYAFWTCVRARARCAATGVMSERGRRFLAENRPAVTVSGHIGCWEILSQLAFLEGHPMMSVAKDIGTGGMTALLMRARRSIGQEIVPAGWQVARASSGPERFAEARRRLGEVPGHSDGGLGSAGLLRRERQGDDCCRLVSSASRRALSLRGRGHDSGGGGAGHLGDDAALRVGSGADRPPPSVLLGAELQLLQQPSAP